MASSSQLPEGGLPFGYNFSDEPFLRPPPSPHGEPILGPNDNNWLGHFFTDLESNETNIWSFGEGVDVSEHWFNQVAPNLLGHSTSFGPQPNMAQTAMTGLPSANFENVLAFEPDIMPPPPPPVLPTRPPQPPTPQQQQHRPQSQPTLHHFHQHLSHSFHDQRSSHVPIEQDAHAHAAALLALQSGHPNVHQPRTSRLNSFHSPTNVQSPGNHRGSFSQPIAAQNLGSPVSSTRPSETDALFVNMILGSRGITAQRPAAPLEFQFGSDPTFDRSQGFVPPQHESSEALEKKRINTVKEALEYTISTPNTQPSSPVRNKEVATHTTLENSNGNIHTEENAATPLRKRRRSKAKVEPEEDGEYAVQLLSKAPARKRKSKGDLNGSPDSSSTTQEMSGKRRKSAPSQPKPPRENLTDAQKRENHIKSEQKRRGAIKEGFDDLVFIVPNLQNGGYSKSSMLNLAGDWLESLIKENQMLDSERTYPL
ncbi:hypothetical protein F4859DRAFT_528527 [Xylaria cf. heliscus]|nr:hypothetical protein F4859DRAFT_528527 [Xylaria cf. heliscus]